MKLESVGFLISLRPFNERDVIARIFSREFGVIAGMMRGAIVARRSRPLIGQFGAVTWNARLDSELGVFHWEPEHNMVAMIMNDSTKLAFANAMFDLITTMLPERESYVRLYNDTYEFLSGLGQSSNVANEYLGWELSLLCEMGYALDLTHCSGCGKTEHLHYISPKTGRAVCETCATPYISRLYKMPVSLDITLKFLEKICSDIGVNVPMARKMIAQKNFS
jgi:DNA repair protein RecO (recombination protein O)